MIGKTDVYIETIQKWFARVSSVMIWIGFFALMVTKFSLFVLVIIFIALILLVILMVWFDVKYIIPSKQKFLGEMNPVLIDIKERLKRIEKRVSERKEKM